MIFFNSQVLFVHNPKTAGTSLLQFFRDAFDEPFHTAGTPELGTYHPSLARACSYACAVMSVKPEQFRKIITCVRNPYAREVSMYWYFRDVLSTSPGAERDLNNPVLLNCVHQASGMDFADYLEWLFGEFGTVDIWDSKSYIYDDRSAKPENLTVWRVETLADDIANTLPSLGQLKRPIPALPFLNATGHNGYRTYYTDGSREIVAKTYEWLFDGYGYSRALQ